MTITGSGTGGRPLSPTDPACDFSSEMARESLGRPIPWALFLSELIGTALLVLVGLSLVILLFGADTPMARLIPSEGLRRLITGFLFGTTGACIALSPVGRVSGAHINPAVTLAFRLMGKVDLPTTLGYIGAQLIGAIVGSLPLLLWGAMGKSVAFGATLPGPGTTLATVLLGEVITTFAMVALLAVFLGFRTIRPFTPAIFPPLYAIMVWVESPISGTSTNPARSLGPSVVSGQWQGWWIYWLGPITGMLLAVLACSFLAKRIEVAKLYHFDRDRDRLFRRMAGPAARLAILVTALAASVPGAAQEPAQQPTPQHESSSPSPSPSEPTKDIVDILRDLRHKPPPPATGPDDYKKWMVAAAPVLTYGPTTGFGIGAAGNVAFYKGFPDTTRISSLVASVTATTKEQLLVNAKLNASTLHNRWHFEGDNRLYWTSQKTYGLGTNTAEDAAVDQKYDYFRFYEALYRRVGGDVYLGAGFLYSNHTDVRPADDTASAAWPASPYVAYSEQHGLDPASQTSAGLSLHALVDSRDGAINPSRGWYAGLAYRAYFGGFLGGASNWQQLSYDLRTYLRLSRDARHKVGFWLYGDFVTGGTAPYLDLPATGMDTYGRSGRGYPQGRFRGESLVYGEAEYRWTVTKNGLFGLVAFLNTETLRNVQTGEKLFDSFASGAGFGARLMLNKRSQTNLCFDVGWGKEGSHAVYFAVQEAF